MFGRRKKQKDLWTLRPGDLPPANVVAREPRLAGLENNALFRLSTFHSRLKRRNKASATTQWVDVGLVLLFLLGGIFGFLFVFVFVIARAIYRRTNINHRKPHTLCSLFNVDTEHMIDLRQAAIARADLLHAAWGLETRRKRNQILGFDIALGIELIVTLVLIGKFPESIVVLGPALGVLNGFIFWQRIVHADVVNSALRDTGLKLHEMASLSSIGRQIANSIGQMSVLIGMLFFIFVSYTGLHGPGGRYQAFILPALVSSILCMLVGAAAGAIQRNQNRECNGNFYNDALEHAQILLRKFDDYIYAEKK